MKRTGAKVVMGLLLVAAFALAPPVQARTLWHCVHCPEASSILPLDELLLSLAVEATPVLPDAPQVPGPYRGMGDGMVGEWESEVASHFPPPEVEMALCIIQHESGGNPNAANPSGAKGLFQIKSQIWAAPYGLDDDDLFTPDTNIWLAHKIWQSYGWVPWNGYAACK